MIRWCRAIGQEPHLGLNVLLTDGERMVGSRWQTHAALPASGPATALPGVRARRHAAGARDDYRALIIASEPTNDGRGPRSPNARLFEITPDLRLRIQPLDES